MELLLVPYWFLLVFGLSYLLVESALFEAPREWFLSAVKREDEMPKTKGLSPNEAAHVSVLTVWTQPRPNRLRVFIGRVLSCWQCTAGQSALPSAAFAVGLYFAAYHSVWWAVISILVLTLPPIAIGFVALVEQLSPLRASDRIVNTMVDVSVAIMENMDTKKKGN